MAFIEKADLKTVTYQEYIDEIIRDDDTIATTAIETAMQEATTYLGRYDSETIFASTGTDKLKYTLLIALIKDVALWYIIKLSNGGIDYDIAKSNYETALKSLNKIQSTVIKGWPLAESGSYTSNLRYGSNPKFNTERW